jgi:unsaturated rhamnogalacturonyl hydrolase
MFVYAIAKAVRQAYLPIEYLVCAQRAYRGILAEFVTIDDRGLVNLEGTCSVAGLGGSPYRDGSYEYYVSEPIATNDYKGVGAFILAAVEIERAGQNPVGL